MAIQDHVIPPEKYAEFVPGSDLDLINENWAKHKARVAAEDEAEKNKKKAEEAAKKANPKSTDGKDGADKAMAADKKARQGAGDSASGIFSDIICCKMPNLLSRLKNLKFDLGLGKYLNWNPSMQFSVCGKQMNLNLMDALGGVAKFIQKNPGILSFDKDAMLAALMRSDLLNKMDAFGLKRLLRDCILNRFTNAQAGLYGSDGSFGPSLASRNYLRTKMAQDPCLAAIGKLPIISDFLANNNIGLLLSTVMYMHDHGWNAEGWFSLTDGIFNVLGLRNNAIAGLAKSLAYSVDYNTYKVKHKLAAGVHYKKQGVITKQHAGIIYTPPKVIIENLDKDTKYEEDVEKKTLAPELAQKQFELIVDGLDVFSPGWQEHEAACSSTVKKTIEVAFSIRKGTPELTGKYSKSTLSKIHRMALINKFNCCSGCKPTAGQTAFKAPCNCA